MLSKQLLTGASAHCAESLDFRGNAKTGSGVVCFDEHLIVLYAKVHLITFYQGQFDYSTLLS